MEIAVMTILGNYLVNLKQKFCDIPLDFPDLAQNKTQLAGDRKNILGIDYTCNFIEWLTFVCKIWEKFENYRIANLFILKHLNVQI